jgi:senataxin
LLLEWEIRIDEAIDPPRVYFVNHKDKKTTYEVPPPPESGEKYFPAKSMPEYRTFVSKIVKMVERYNNINTKIERYNLCRNAAATASSSGGGGRHSHAMNDIRIQLETHILDSVHIVLTTLGTAGNRALEAANKFEVVVIDEAAQSVEPSTLVRLCYV